MSYSGVGLARPVGLTSSLPWYFQLFSPTGVEPPVPLHVVIVRP
jgi:hypothetical protein